MGTEADIRQIWNRIHQIENDHKEQIDSLETKIDSLEREVDELRKEVRNRSEKSKEISV